MACVQLCLLAGLVAGVARSSWAGPEAVGTGADAKTWLQRIHTAASTRNYQGTMVMSSGVTMSSSRVTHYCVGDQSYERIDALDGRHRKVFRHNDVVQTVWPQAGVAIIERRSLPSLLSSKGWDLDGRALDQYEWRAEGRDRVAGREALVFLLQPRDDLRFARRLWADQDSGLLLRSDVIGPDKAVLERQGFSEVEIGIRAQPESVLQAMRKLDGLRVVKRDYQPVQLEAQGWTQVRSVNGFKLSGCFRRVIEGALGAEAPSGSREVTQAVFSDGLTHVSLFIEPFDATRHRHELQAQLGATHSLAVRRGEHWITAMGDVPSATLRQLVEAVERRP